ncbi:MAG: hypothetical protein FJW50_03760, partial [Actinobacteria bacterium]|nr:hypothetical protein [Actinomycetota bacterium]
MASLTVPFAVSSPSAASSPTVTVGTTSFPASVATNPNITLSGFDTGLSYQVTVKFVNSSTNVDVTNGTLTATQGTTSLISGYTSYTAQLKLGFKGTYSAIATALSTVTWTPAASGADISMRIGITEEPGTNSFYDANSGHYYEYVSTGLAWTAARTAAEGRTKFGMTGYLAMITSEAENNFIKGETTATNIWIGATDAATEGTWIWDGATGANKPTVTGSNAGSSAAFQSWASGEPNDYNHNEDCAVTNWGGLNGNWNDLPCGNAYAYLIEYGSRIGQSSSAISATKTEIVTIVVAGAPGAPTLSTISPGDSQLSVAFTAGSGDGITKYQYSLDGAAWVDRASGTTASPLVITGLTNGTAYSVRIRAVNASGNGTTSSAVSATPRGVPGAPTGASASAGEARATVSWSAPTSTGGSAITSYTATSSPGGQTCTTTSTSCVVTGLTGGVAHTFTVVATNAAGNSIASGATAAVTPTSAPATDSGGSSSSDSSSSTTPSTTTPSTTTPSTGGAGVMTPSPVTQRPNTGGVTQLPVGPAPATVQVLTTPTITTDPNRLVATTINDLRSTKGAAVAARVQAALEASIPSISSEIAAATAQLATVLSRRNAPQSEVIRAQANLANATS